MTGIKDVENRTWATDVRGLVLIHAGRTLDDAAVERAAPLLGVAPEEYDPVRGAIVGITEITDCVTSHPSDFFTGPYGFVLRRSRQLPEPVPYRGRLGFFPVLEGAVGHALPRLPPAA